MSKFGIFLFFLVMSYFPLQASSIPYQFMLAPIQRTSYSSVNNSKVSKIYKRMGDSFKKGDLLMELECIIQKNQHQRALAVLDKAGINYASKKVLFEGRVASLDELINLKTELAIAEHDVAIAKKNLDDCFIVAYYDGKVSYVNVEEGEYPNHEYYYNDKPMMETINENTLLAKILIPAYLLPKIHKGLNVTLKINETETTVVAPITRIGAVIDPASATVLIEVAVDNHEKKLMSGMTGRAELEPLTRDER